MKKKSGDQNYCGILSANKLYWNENICSRSAFRCQ